MKSRSHIWKRRHAGFCMADGFCRCHRSHGAHLVDGLHGLYSLYGFIAWTVSVHYIEPMYSIDYMGAMESIHFMESIGIYGYIDFIAYIVCGWFLPWMSKTLFWLREGGKSLQFDQYLNAHTSTTWYALFMNIQEDPVLNVSEHSRNDP